MRIGKVLAVAGAKGVPGAGKERVHRTPAGTEVARRGEAGGQVGRWGEPVWVPFPGLLAILHLSLWAPVLCPQKLPFMGYCFSLFVQFLGGLSQCEAPSGDKRVRPEIKSSFPVPSHQAHLAVWCFLPKATAPEK